MSVTALVPFQPLGETARWRLIYALLQRHEIGDVVDYFELGQALGLHPDDDRNKIQVAFRRAAKEYLEVDLRATEAVGGVGYRLVETTEQMRLATLHGRKARKSVERGQTLTTNVDLNLIPDAETRKAFELVSAGFGAVVDMMARTELRQHHVEQAVATVATKQEHSAVELDELRARLERLERSLPPE